MIKPNCLIAYTDRGAVAESLFDAKILSLGYIVSKPVNLGSSYDRIVDSGKILKIQIKCIWSQSNERRNYRMYFKRTANKSYGSEGIDYFAVYVKEFDCWYIVPASIGKSKTVSDEYKERWDLLKP